MAKILILDDEGIIGTALSFALRKENYEIVVLKHPAEVISHLSDGDFNLFILDYSLLIMSGYDIIKLINHYDITIPTVMLSSQQIDSSKLTEMNVISFISKDQPISAIKDKIEDILLTNHNHI